MSNTSSPGVSEYARNYADKLKTLLRRQSERHTSHVFLAGVWIPESELARAQSKLKSNKRALFLLVHLGTGLLLFAMLIFWALFADLFLP